MLARSRPVVAAEQNAHTPPRTAPSPNRNRAARNASAIERSSSASPSASGGARAGGSPSSTAKRTNHPRSMSAPARSRRSHERTVEQGRPSATAIGRYPPPAAAIRSAHPTASTSTDPPSEQEPLQQRVRALTIPTARPPHPQPELRAPDAHPAPIAAPGAELARARRAAQPRRQRRADPDPQQRPHPLPRYGYDQHQRNAPEGPRRSHQRWGALFLFQEHAAKSRRSGVLPASPTRAADGNPRPRSSPRADPEPQ